MTTSHIKNHIAIKQNPVRPFWRSPLMLVVPVVIVGLLFFASTRQQPYVPEITGRPAVQVDQELFDYGDVTVGTMVNTVFHVKNIGDKTLLILDEPYVQVVEGCCPPQTQVSSRRLSPGEEATVSMSFSMHPGMAGYHKFLVHVITNDPVQEDKQVVVLSNWLE
jgi:hypothetical protein